MDANLDSNFLRRAVDLSIQSLEAGGFPVAAVLVRDGKEIARGFSCTELSGDVTAHGEMQAIRQAGRNVGSPLTLYSSLEPCLMCLAASAWAGVTRIVYGCRQAAVDASYYVNQVDTQATSALLRAPPVLVLIDQYENEILNLIKAYEERAASGRLF